MSDNSKHWINFSIRPLEASDSVWVDEFITDHWGSPLVAVTGRLLQPSHFPGFIAESGGQPVGLITYRLCQLECEIISLNSEKPKAGIGTALIAAVRTLCSKAGCKRLWLVTTNDNVNAIRFYQNMGFQITAVHTGAVDQDRTYLKPQIPLIGEDDVPIHDYFELEMRLIS
ncbi:MAG TPA: GNAT family N-acetyltransferase [Longilinea sp.]|nr:GNAT family N-acetyltransferase [Longilinea sp.]